MCAAGRRVTFMVNGAGAPQSFAARSALAISLVDADTLAQLIDGLLELMGQSPDLTPAPLLPLRPP
jgi:hypothetical protein